MKTFQTFADAYPRVLEEILFHGTEVQGVESPSSIGSAFGTKLRPFLEIIGGGFRIEDPRGRWLSGGPRQPNAAFAAANFLFTLAGGHEPEMISVYNSRGRQFTEDSSRFESAFGARLFSPGHQLAYAAKKLVDDKMSRRAVALIYNPDDTMLDRRDTPCAIAIQFMIRNNRLNAVCFMRSQSAAMVMPYDIFLFTMIQEWMAGMLGVELGTYTHLSASLHLYTEEKGLAESIIGATPYPAHVMPHMTSSGHSVAVSLIESERALRLIGQEARVDHSLDGYWQEFLRPIRDVHTSAPKANSYFGFETDHEA